MYKKNLSRIWVAAQNCKCEVVARAREAARAPTAHPLPSRQPRPPSLSLVLFPKFVRVQPRRLCHTRIQLRPLGIPSPAPGSWLADPASGPCPSSARQYVRLFPLTRPSVVRLRRRGASGKFSDEDWTPWPKFSRTKIERKKDTAVRTRRTRRGRGGWRYRWYGSPSGYGWKWCLGCVSPYFSSHIVIVSKAGAN